MKTHTIDCDKDPFIPPGWTVEEHQKGGKLKWNPKNVELYLSDKQKTGYIEGNDLRKELKDTPVLNANVLDYLLKNPKLIPEDWKGKYVFFWGTIYRNSGGGLYVRFLYWSGGRWYWSYYYLDYGWYGYDPAAVPASPLALKPLESPGSLLSLELRVKSLEDWRDKITKALIQEER